MVRLYTIGHSTRSLEELIIALVAYGVQRLVDVRTLPGSRRLPHFNQEVLARELPRAGIAYQHLLALGGLRRGVNPASPNTGWRSAGFRAFADYMATEEFRRGIAQLIAQAQAQPIAIMCAEVLPWRCHRSLISDALAIRGVGVIHIYSQHKAEPHHITPFAQVQGDRLIYPAIQPGPPA